MKSVNISGQKFGKLFAIERKANRKSHSYWLCRCDCGNTKEIASTHLIRGNTISCGCIVGISGEASRWYRGYAGLSGSKWADIKCKAKSRNIPFNLSIKEAWEKFQMQKQKCALSGRSIELAKTSRGKATASLDRIDSTKPYCNDNIQWVHKDVYWMKNHFNQDYFISMCKDIAANS